MKKILLAVVAVFCATGFASAQEPGDWGVGPRMSIFTHTGTGGTILGVGAAARYSFTDAWRVESGLSAILQKGCSVEFTADAHYMFQVADSWTVYPMAGISVADMGITLFGIGLGGGMDFAIANKWDLNAGVKYLIETKKGVKNPIVFQVGAVYRF